MDERIKREMRRQNITDQQIEDMVTRLRKWAAEHPDRGAIVIAYCDQSMPPHVTFEAFGPGWLADALLESVIERPRL